ncbi:hypothetical protein [Methylibium sp.]|uniref:hypothetical protein n=1 Tax=Methylibium sp. TaxID=2067992 RepID=UPI003D12D541
MASLMFSSEWCVGAGSSDRTTAIGAHLVSMFLLPCLLRACGVRVAAAWLALPMGASAMLLVVLPGADGLMAASMTQSLAWGLSFVVGPKHAPSVNGEVGAAGFSLALVAIGAVIALGLAGSAVGPFALLSVHAALGIGAVTAALVSISPLATAVAWR